MKNKNLNQGGTWPTLTQKDAHKRVGAVNFRPLAIVYEAILGKQLEMSHDLPTVTKTDAVNAIVLEWIDSQEAK